MLLVCSPPAIVVGGEQTRIGLASIPFHASFVGDRAALQDLRRKTEFLGVRPRQVEHDLAWLAETDHGERCSAGALVLSAGTELLGYVPLRCRRASLALRVGEISALRLPYTTIQLFGQAVLGEADGLAEAALE